MKYMDTNQFEILEWQDHWTAKIYDRWSTLYGMLCDEIDDAFKRMTTRERIQKQSFYNEKISPLVDKQSRIAVGRLQKEIQDSLNTLKTGIAMHHDGYLNPVRQIQAEGDSSKKLIGATLSTALGAAAIPIAISQATTATTFLGITLFTTVSAPVVATGVVAALALGSTGVFKSNDYLSSSVEDFKKGVKQKVFEMLLFSPAEDSLSLSQCMQQSIYEIAQQLSVADRQFYEQNASVARC
jgi:hypothetical protein